MTGGLTMTDYAERFDRSGQCTVYLQGARDRRPGAVTIRDKEKRGNDGC
jgi:hypothetical protein